MIYKFLFLISFTILLSGIIQLRGQGAEEDSTGLPGDNFSLQGALEMFKKANSPEEFEKLINMQDNNVNNLDLNEDGDIDDIRVIGKKEKDLHAFVLQVPVSETENQDIAVIELEKTGEETAMLQIVGDEDIYGEQTIVEPSEEGEVESEKGDGADTEFIVSKKAVVVNVWLWPSVRFVYRPGYVVWGFTMEVEGVSGMMAPMETIDLESLSSSKMAISSPLCRRAYSSGCACPSNIYADEENFSDCNESPFC